MLILWFCTVLFTALQVAALLPASGTVNSTVFIVPVTREFARALVPSKYDLLPVDLNVLPGFPSGSHPLVVIGAKDYNIPSSSSPLLFFSRAQVQIPFVDRLHDGKSPFSLNKFAFTDNLVTLAALISTAAVPSALANINPPLGVNNAVYEDAGRLKFTADGVLGGYVHLDVTPATGASPWPLEAYTTLSNQPGFGTLAPDCFVHIETITSTPTVVTGTVSLGSPPLSGAPLVANNVYGVMAVRSFEENLINNCADYAS